VYFLVVVVVVGGDGGNGGLGMEYWCRDVGDGGV